MRLLTLVVICCLLMDCDATSVIPSLDLVPCTCVPPQNLTELVFCREIVNYPSCVNDTKIADDRAFSAFTTGQTYMGDNT